MKYLYPLFSLALVILISFFSLNYWQGHYQEFSDLSFHAASAVGFQRAGGLALANFWSAYTTESSPILYLPFFHILQLLFLSAGFSVSFIIYWLSWVFLPLFLISFFIFTYYAYGMKAAAYAMFFLTLSPILIDNQLGRSPQALVLFLTPLIFLALLKNRYITVIILTLLCMATNYLGMFLALFLFIYALHEKNRRRPALLTLGAIILISSPFIFLSLQWLIKSKTLFMESSGGGFTPLLCFRSRFLLAFAQGAILPSVKNSLLYLFDIRRSFHSYLGYLAVIGTVICYFKRGKFMILPSYFFAYFSIAFTNQEIRFWGACCLFIFSLLGSVTLLTCHDWIEKRKHGQAKGILFFVFVLFLGSMFFYAVSGSVPIVKTPAVISLSSLNIPKNQDKPLSNDSFNMIKIMRIVKKQVREDEFFWINSSHNINNFISANTRRSVILSTPQNAGVVPAKGIKLVVDKNNPSEDYIFLEKINYEFNAYILKNIGQAAKVKIPPPLLKTKQLVFIFVIICLIIILDIFGIFLPFLQKKACVN